MFSNNRLLILVGIISAGLFLLGYGVFWMTAALWFSAALPAQLASLDSVTLRVSGNPAAEITGFPFRLRSRIERVEVTHLPSGYRMVLPRIDFVSQPWSPGTVRLNIKGPIRVLDKDSIARAAILSDDMSADLSLGETLQRDIALRFAEPRLQMGRASVKMQSLRMVWRQRAASREISFHIGRVVDQAEDAVPVDQLDIRMALPQELPGLHPSALAAWRDSGGRVDMRTITIVSGPLSVAMTGWLGLNDGLFLRGELEVDVRGQRTHLEKWPAFWITLLGRDDPAATLALYDPENVDHVRAKLRFSRGRAFFGPLPIRDMTPVSDWLAPLTEELPPPQLPQMTAP